MTLAYDSRSLNEDPDAVQGPAPRQLDRYLCFSGPVLHGAKLGRTIGFPTANIAILTRSPEIGIYAAMVRLQDDRVFMGVGYYGNRPTVDGVGELLEVFLFDFKEEIYGMEIHITLAAFIRGDIKFSSIEAMKDQIARDSEQALKWLEALPGLTSVRRRENV